MDTLLLLKALDECGHYLYRRKGGRYGQVRILRIVKKRGKISQKELQDILEIKSGSVSEIAAKMENKGYIKRTRDGEDKRKIYISIEEEGEKLLAEKAWEREHILFNALSESEQEELYILISKLLENWRDKFYYDKIH